MAKFATILSSASERINSLSTAFAALEASRALASVESAVDSFLAANPHGADVGNLADHMRSIASVAEIKAIFGSDAVAPEMRISPKTGNLEKKGKDKYFFPFLADLLAKAHARRAESAPVTTPQAMAQRPGVDLVTGGRHDATVQPPLPQATKIENGDSQNMRERPSVCTYDMLGIASVECEVKFGEDAASRSLIAPDSDATAKRLCKVHAMGHGKMTRKGEIFAITFRVEHDWTENATDVPWTNPSNIDASGVAEMVERLTASCGIDPERLTFFVDASMPYRCEKVNGIRTQAATETLKMKESLFAPMDDNTNTRAKARPTDY